HDCSDPQTARLLLMNPLVEAAVFEAASAGILRGGLGYDRADVAGVTDLGTADRLGFRGPTAPEEVARVQGTVVGALRRGGAAVLNAADPLVDAMAKETDERIIYFARDAALERIRT